MTGLDGDARSFLDGVAARRHYCAGFCRAETHGRLHATQQGDVLDVAPGAKLRLEGESYALVRLFEG